MEQNEQRKWRTNVAIDKTEESADDETMEESKKEKCIKKDSEMWENDYKTEQKEWRNTKMKCKLGEYQHKKNQQEEKPET